MLIITVGKAPTVREDTLRTLQFLCDCQSDMSLIAESAFDGIARPGSAPADWTSRLCGTFVVEVIIDDSFIAAPAQNQGLFLAWFGTEGECHREVAKL
jgi:hypothetical protein